MKNALMLAIVIFVNLQLFGQSLNEVLNDPNYKKYFQDVSFDKIVVPDRIEPLFFKSDIDLRNMDGCFYVKNQYVYWLPKALSDQQIIVFDLTNKRINSISGSFYGIYGSNIYIKSLGNKLQILKNFDEISDTTSYLISMLENPAVLDVIDGPIFPFNKSGKLLLRYSGKYVFYDTTYSFGLNTNITRPAEWSPNGSYIITKYLDFNFCWAVSQNAKIDDLEEKSYFVNDNLICVNYWPEIYDELNLKFGLIYFKYKTINKVLRTDALIMRINDPRFIQISENKYFIIDGLLTSDYSLEGSNPLRFYLATIRY